MSVIPLNGRPAALGEAHRGNGRERILLALILYTVGRSAEALAGDQASAEAAVNHAADSHRAPISTASLLATPAFSTDRSVTEADSFSATDFRPRAHSVFEADPAKGASSGSLAPMLQSTTIWQQMAQYKSQDRVRLLTLWQTRGSSLSLQAGKHGGPSLQWSSPWMAREGAAGGLFDHLFSPSMRASGNAWRTSPVRPPAAVPATKPADLSPTIGTK
jgi:hypothetical protein